MELQLVFDARIGQTLTELAHQRGAIAFSALEATFSERLPASGKLRQAIGAREGRA
jgi:hypothetical protein